MKTRKKNSQLTGKYGIQLKFDFKNESIVPPTKRKSSWLKSLGQELAKEMLKEAIKELAKHVIRNFPQYFDLIKEILRSWFLPLI